MLITTIILNFNRAVNRIDTSLDFSRFNLEALSVMTSHIEQLSQYFFDEASTDTTNDKELSDFATPQQLGFDSGDENLVDDIDDLHGVTLVDTGISGVVYNVDYCIDYVTLQNNDITASLTRQWHKRVSIAVSDAYEPPLIYRIENGEHLRDTLKVSIVVSYWFYN